jgi:hypothetical protein
MHGWCVVVNGFKHGGVLDDRRLQRYVTHNLSGWGVRAGPRNACQGWGVP